MHDIAYLIEKGHYDSGFSSRWGHFYFPTQTQTGKALSLIYNAVATGRLIRLSCTALASRFKNYLFAIPSNL